MSTLSEPSSIMQPLSVGRVAVVGVGVFVLIQGYPGTYNRFPLPLVNDGTIYHQVDWKAMTQAAIDTLVGQNAALKDNLQLTQNYLAKAEAEIAGYKKEKRRRRHQKRRIVMGQTKRRSNNPDATRFVKAGDPQDVQDAAYGVWTVALVRRLAWASR